ncbi:MAG: putative porin [Bacteroidota bacterium]
MSKEHLFISVILFAAINQLRAQDTTRVIKTSTKHITEYELDRGLGYTSLDTSLNRNEIFHAGYKKHIIFQDLGNIGSAMRPLLFNAERSIGFQYGFNPFESYFINPQQTKFFNNKSPYTDLFYTQGSNELIFLQAKHAQNILPRWNMGLDFQRITSQGFLLRQITGMYNYQFFTHYQSKEKRYALLAHATWNRGVNEENGGNQNDSAFEELTGQNKKVVVKLSKAQTRFKTRDAYIKQYYKFGKGRFIKDGEDSIYTFEPSFQLSHRIHTHEESFIFENNGTTDSALLPNRYYDTTSTTYDSAYFGRLSNTIELTWMSNIKTDSSRWLFRTGINYELINASQIVFTRFHYNIGVEGSIEKVSVKNNQVLHGIDAQYITQGYNSGDYKLHAFYTIQNKWFCLTPMVTMQQYRPDYTLQLFKSNQFIWNNTYQAVSFAKLAARMQTNIFRNNFSLTFNRHLLNNFVYVNEKALPQQESSNIQITTVELSKTFQLWKFFFEHQLIFQQSSSNNVRVPEFGGSVRYYFQSRLFKVMTVQLGFDAFYNSSYFGNAYNPASRLFYIQNTTRIGNYPVIDPFLCAEIKRAIIFFKFEHANQDLFNNGFYYTPSYPVSLSSFRMGVRWRMYN